MRPQMGVRVVVHGRDRSHAVYVVSIALLALLQSLQHAHTLPYRGFSEGMYMLPCEYKANDPPSGSATISGLLAAPLRVWGYLARNL